MTVHDKRLDVVAMHDYRIHLEVMRRTFYIHLTDHNPALASSVFWQYAFWTA